MVEDLDPLLWSAVELSTTILLPPLRPVPGIGEEHVLGVAITCPVSLWGCGDMDNHGDEELRRKFMEGRYV